MNLEHEPQIYYLKYIKSQDNGKSWSDPVDITAQISKPQWHKDFKFITSGRGIQTCKGTLLHTLVNLDHGLHLFKSEDHGNRWQLIDSPLIPGTNPKSLNSAMAVGWSILGSTERDTDKPLPPAMKAKHGPPVLTIALLTPVAMPGSSATVQKNQRPKMEFYYLSMPTTRQIGKILPLKSVQMMGKAGRPRKPFMKARRPMPPSHGLKMLTWGLFSKKTITPKTPLSEFPKKRSRHCLIENY